MLPIRRLTKQTKTDMKHFTLAELTYSDTAQARGINNQPNRAQSDSLVALTENVLDPLRERYGRPIQVNSGFRGSALNRAVGGAATSQHLKGEAADITVGSRSGNKQLFDIIRKELDFDQLINEQNYSWVHVSYRADGRNREQVLNL